MGSNSKVVLITGCSEGGIGNALCEAYAAHGCIIYATARRLESMSNLNRPTIHKLKLDVLDDDQVDDVVKTIIDRERRIDILVNNAGTAAPGPVLDMSMDHTRQAFEVHTFAVLRLCRAVAPHMAKHKSGIIVTIGSVTGLFPNPWHGTYAAAKAATHSLMDSLWMECQPLGINVTLIVGGYVKSNLVANARPHFHLPENTLYPTYVSKIYAGLKAGKGFRSDATATDVFAERVAKETMKKNPPRYLCFGGRSTWYKVFVWLPRVLVLMYLWRTLGK
ncbi:hypothetical protein QCA50_010314 [Cerrena zonata]|uniref:Ketoreductase domain-containing protein n=1 Tax=Cerrena zonata TaxID=2478898 RepID=A0AAW0G4V4_9APHY